MNSFDLSLHACLDAKSHLTVRTFVRLFAFMNNVDVPGKAVQIYKVRIVKDLRKTMKCYHST